MNARITSASMPPKHRSPRIPRRQARERGGRGTRAEDGAIRGAGRVRRGHQRHGQHQRADDRPSPERGGARRRDGGESGAGARAGDDVQGRRAARRQLTPLLGKQVEVRATLDANTMGTAALRQPGTTMGREPANTPSASTPPPAPAQAPADGGGPAGHASGPGHAARTEGHRRSRQPAAAARARKEAGRQGSDRRSSPAEVADD